MPERRSVVTRLSLVEARAMDGITHHRGYTVGILCLALESQPTIAHPQGDFSYHHASSLLLDPA